MGVAILSGHRCAGRIVICGPSFPARSPREFGGPVNTATFTFAKREFDDAFHALDQVIAVTAKSLPGYLGEESWENSATGLVSNVYYWESMEALRALIEHPAHQAAKREQARWLAGYQVVIARVLGNYGDGKIDHPLAQATAKTPQGPGIACVVLRLTSPLFSA
jgi:heme-degrading monooxygenase HmoA